MGYGGPTWDTAGTLSLGNGNTFDPADVTEVTGLSPYYNHAWWTFTAPASAHYVIDADGSEPDGLRMRVGVYVGATVDDAELVGGTFSSEFDGTIGTTYHILAATRDEDGNGVTLYRLNLVSSAPLIVSPWFDTLSTREDNQLVVSDGALGEENPESFQFVPWGPEIFGTTARMPPRRTGAWATLQSLGGPDTGGAGAVNCVWDHAKNGDGGAPGEGGGVWDGTCAALGDGPAVRQSANTTVAWQIHVHDGGPFGEGGSSASATIRAQGVWFGLARQYLAEQGILDIPDPTSQGYPSTAQIEWEGDLKLVRIEMAGDSSERPPEGTTDSLDPLTYMLRREVAPTYLGGDPLTEDVWTPFDRGNALIWDGSKTDVTFSWADGDPIWTEVDGLVTGTTGWDGLATSYEDQPDEVVVIALGRSLLTPPDLNSNGRDARTAVRYTFQSPRYRWVYEAPASAPAPHRLLQRAADGLAGGSPRTYRRAGTNYGSNRTIGGVR